jgi:hypothetical protein
MSVLPKEIHDAVLVESSDTVNLWSMLMVIWHIPLIRAVFVPLQDLARNTSKTSPLVLFMFYYSQRRKGNELKAGQ